ncbi:L,D-transpeptidase family protein [Halioglobus maricola]|nr:L,D-transpeptidase family protein [Halioglobus maricola]
MRILILLSLLMVSLTAKADLRGELQSLTEHLVVDGGSQLPSGGRVHLPVIVEDFYSRQDYQAAWQDRQQAQRMLDLLRGSFDDGLSPDDYHYSELMALWSLRNDEWPEKDRARARFDVLLTDGILLYIQHMAKGKVDPRLLDPTFNYAQLDFDIHTISGQLQQAIAEDSIDEILERLRPAMPFYYQMVAALRHYRALAASGEFRALPTDVVLKPGQEYPVVPDLAERLVQLGYLPSAGPDRRYGGAVQDAVRVFQRDHGLDVDGIVGAQSYHFLNMTPAERVDALRVNLDRVRWIAQDLSDEMLVVNVAGYELYYIRGDELLWETPVMVGTIAHQTPIFTKRLRYLEFNPTWTVPRSIIGRSLLPKFKADQSYIAEQNYLLYDRRGEVVNPASIDWANANMGNFPYRVVQQPWESNALGRVKFMFPNSYAIYLHDTPSRYLFSRSARAFSSGCVRVKEPLRLAELLLDDSQQWSLSQVEAVVDSRKPQVRVPMEREVDVMLMYWTTSPARDGRMQFHADIYGKDAPALAILDAPPEAS